MMILDRRLILGLGLALGATGVLPVSAKADICGAAFPDCVQITFSSLSARQQSYSAFRIMPDDTVHFARWSGQKQLLALGAPSRRPGISYQSALETVSGAFRWYLTDGTGGGEGQFVNWVEVAHFGAHKTRSKVLTTPTKELHALIGKLSDGAVTFTPMAGQKYVWTTPVQSAGIVDVQMKQPPCAGPIEQAIATSLATGTIAVPVDGGTAPYLSGENTNRIVFVADIAGRLTQFGVVAA